MSDQQLSAQPNSQSSSTSYVDAYDSPTVPPVASGAHVATQPPAWSASQPQPGPVIDEAPIVQAGPNPFNRTPNPFAQPNTTPLAPTSVNTPMTASSDTPSPFARQPITSSSSMNTIPVSSGVVTPDPVPSKYDQYDDYDVVDEPVNPVVESSASADSASSATTSENLEDQNIFDLLGVAKVSDEEKEAFLDELQQVIWEDFLENDVELLLTSEEVASMKQLMGDRSKNDPELQEQVITYLEKLIPDLEEIMLEKALELKEDMVRERLAGLREYFAGQSEKLAQLDKAEQLMADAQWRSSADVMNQLLS